MRRPSRASDKDPRAVALGRRGGQARRRNMHPAARREAARKAALARWARRTDAGA